MAVKIDGKKLHLTTFEVPTSGRNMKLCLKMQKEMVKLNASINGIKEDDDESLIKSLDVQMEFTDEIVEFLKKVLKLNDKQADKVEDGNFYDVVDVANDVIAKVLRLDQNKSDSSAE